MTNYDVPLPLDLGDGPENFAVRRHCMYVAIAPSLNLVKPGSTTSPEHRIPQLANGTYLRGVAVEVLAGWQARRTAEAAFHHRHRADRCIIAGCREFYYPTRSVVEDITGQLRTAVGRSAYHWTVIRKEIRHGRRAVGDVERLLDLMHEIYAENESYDL